jgi:aminoglycoside phosphotransferase (APT) family kinase protein
VWREAEFYRAIQTSDVPAPKLIAVNEEFQAILTEHVSGRADYRRLADEQQRVTVAREFVESLVKLHSLPIDELDVPGLWPQATIADCVKRELDIWQAMYVESGRADPLIDFALEWLYQNLPNPPGRPVLVHGDAGPGNFLFEDGHLTALLDWELAHPGDPMEDLAWFSMRAVMEPVPDFPERIREYGMLMGVPADVARIRYHRVFVSLRVVIIRHRNVTGQPGNSIVSAALNRRLLVAALAKASGIELPPALPIEAPPTARTPLYDSVLKDLREEIVAIGGDPRVAAAGKNAAKVLKYLRDVDRFGNVVEIQELAALTALLGKTPESIQAGQEALLCAMRARTISFESIIKLFAGTTAREAKLAAASSGGLARRHFPALEYNRDSDV